MSNERMVLSWIVLQLCVACTWAPVKLRRRIARSVLAWDPLWIHPDAIE